MDTWHFLYSAPELNCSPEQFSDCFFNPTFHKSTDQFESALSSTISSPAMFNSVISTGKLSTICNSGPESKNSMTIRPNLPSLSGDPGFAERAAKFSRFGSRSFNGRPTQFRSNHIIELPNKSETPLMGGNNLHRVSSSPSLKNSTQTQITMRSDNGSVSALNNKNSNKLPNSDNSDRTELANSNESSVSEQEQKTPNEMNSRKRKSISRGKSKFAEIEEDSDSKRFKEKEIENESVKTGEGSETKGSPKAAEPLKDYIHVRARRGQATDSHSLAERVRREKIGERMKLLQDLVPGCNKVTGKALMLDEIINYVQSLQCQVEFLSMKLASVNPDLDIDINGLLSKERFQPNRPLPQPVVHPLGASAPAFYGHQPHQSQQVHTSVSKCSVDPLETTLFRSIGLNLPPIHEIGHGLPQFGVFCEDDLQNFVQMGYGQNPNH